MCLTLYLARLRTLAVDLYQFGTYSNTNQQMKAVLKGNLEVLSNMLLFHYLVNALERDLVPQSQMNKETMNWILVLESLLNNMILENELQRINEGLCDYPVWIGSISC
uniref:Uncharacterized protein n=1 Tax=Cucumis melo TaxID=3656 RepID=A0A9I9EAK9_CUCME